MKIIQISKLVYLLEMLGQGYNNDCNKLIMSTTNKQNDMKPLPRNKSKNRQNSYQADDFTPYQKSSPNESSSYKRYIKNKAYFFRSIDSKAKLSKSELSNSEKKKMFNSLITSQLDHNRYSQILPWDDFTIEAKPSICNLQFSKRQQVRHRVTKAKFNSTHRKIIMNSMILNPEDKKAAKILQYSQPYQQNQVERVKNNIFVPRVRRADYTQTHKQILEKYYKRIQGMTKSLDKKQKQNILPNLTEVNHLEQLQKFKECLVQFQSDQKYKNYLPKMSIKAEQFDNKPQKMQAPIGLKKKMGKLFKKSKRALDPWEEDKTMDQYFHTIDMWQS